MSPLIPMNFCCFSGCQSDQRNDPQCDVYDSHQPRRSMDVQGEMLIDYMPFHAGHPSWL